MLPDRLTRALLSDGFVGFYKSVQHKAMHAAVRRDTTSPKRKRRVTELQGREID